MLENLRSRAQSLKRDTLALYLAARDPATPWLARLLVILVVAYAVSPIDLIPDFIPVLGSLDDLILVPAGIALAIRIIPAAVMERARREAVTQITDPRTSRLGTLIIVSLWILAVLLCAFFGFTWYQRKSA